MAVKEEIIRPKDKTILEEKYFLRLASGYVWPNNGQPLSMVYLYRDLESAKSALVPGDTLYECNAITRYVCKINVEKE